MQRKAKINGSHEFEEWASPKLQAAFAEPLRTFGELLRPVLDHPEMRLVCEKLLDRGVGLGAIVEHAVFTLGVTLVPHETAKQCAKLVARLKTETEYLYHLADLHPNWREQLCVMAQENELAVEVANLAPGAGINTGDYRARAVGRQVDANARTSFGKVPLKVRCRWLSCFGVKITTEPLRDAVRKSND